MSPPQTFCPAPAQRPKQNNPHPAAAPKANVDLRPYWEHDSRAHLEPGGLLTQWPEGPLNEYNFPIIPPPPPKWGKFVARELGQSPEGTRTYGCPVRGCGLTAAYRDMMEHLKSHGPYCAHCGTPLESDGDIRAHVARWHPHLMR
ncbi:hypothetical protein AURDEDRAFT_171966 [Auricularia subglabra TFB-10046 SS5]|nr:hypothetical protein AURDEDRAFT_171966 [Auricularia subglabra TFB-10046 SS5]